MAGSMLKCGLTIISIPQNPTTVAAIRRPRIISFRNTALISIDQNGEVKASTIASARMRSCSEKMRTTKAAIPQKDRRKWSSGRFVRSAEGPDRISQGNRRQSAKNVRDMATTNTGSSVDICLTITNIVVSVVAASSIHRMPRTLFSVGA